MIIQLLPSFLNIRCFSFINGKWDSAISINGEIGPYFRNKRGVRQGDPSSPLLFDFVVDALDAILLKASAIGHIQGVIPHLIPGGITHFQYADDTMIIIQKSDLALANLKFLLICFDLLSGLKINFHKSEVIVMGNPLEEQARVANVLNCGLGSLSFTYLGFPMSDHRLSLVMAFDVVTCVKRIWLG